MTVELKAEESFRDYVFKMPGLPGPSTLYDHGFINGYNERQKELNLISVAGKEPKKFLLKFIGTGQYTDCQVSLLSDTAEIKNGDEVSVIDIDEYDLLRAENEKLMKALRIGYMNAEDGCCCDTTPCATPCGHCDALADMCRIFGGKSNLKKLINEND